MQAAWTSQQSLPPTSLFWTKINILHFRVNLRQSGNAGSTPSMLGSWSAHKIEQHNWQNTPCIITLVLSTNNSQAAGCQYRALLPHDKFLSQWYNDWNQFFRQTSIWTWIISEAEETCLNTIPCHIYAWALENVVCVDYMSNLCSNQRSRSHTLWVMIVGVGVDGVLANTSHRHLSLESGVRILNVLKIVWQHLTKLQTKLTSYSQKKCCLTE